MSRSSDFDLRNAVTAFVVANTPLFLLRKLQSEESLIRQINESTSERALISKLKAALRTKPKNLHSAVRPYVYLVALANREAFMALKQFAGHHYEAYPWFEYLTDVILQTGQTTTMTEATLNLVLKPSIESKSQSQATASHLQLVQN
ncbi:hypothetical protein NKH28_32010 [Mesorhizobium sp. M1227]|uniref:hypothetical protein n=1 Tax=Mesorhizobium sp. M1227 TaxID=2957071 RepID=UPI00333B4923